MMRPWILPWVFCKKYYLQKPHNNQNYSLLKYIEIATSFVPSSSMQSLSLILLHVQFKYFKVNIFIIGILVSAKPHLDVVTGWRRDLFPEPWWRVDVTAGVVLPTSSTIPERIVSIEDELVEVLTTSVTEVVVSDKARY